MARVSPKVVSAAATAVLLLAATLTKPWEGRRHYPYADIGDVATVCDGHTGHVEDRRYSDDECDALLMGDLAEAYSYVVKCIHVPLERHQAAALTDAVYNLGPVVVCGSALQKQANAGQSALVWCKRLLDFSRVKDHFDRVKKRWVYRFVPGLYRRRQAEVAMCVGAA